MQTKPYSWIHIVTTLTEDGAVLQQVAVTVAEDKNHGIDDLLYSHRSQLGSRGVVWSSLASKHCSGYECCEKLLWGNSKVNI